MTTTNQFLFAVKIYHSQRTETVNLESFEAADGLVKEMEEQGLRTKAYEIKDGKTLEMYSGRDINADQEEYISDLESI